MRNSKPLEIGGYTVTRGDESITGTHYLLGKPVVTGTFSSNRTRASQQTAEDGDRRGCRFVTNPITLFTELKLLLFPFSPRPSAAGVRAVSV